MRIALRAAAVNASPTVELDARAKALQAEGKPVINLTAGELDFSPLPQVIASAQFAATHAFRYTPVAGLPELRQAAATYVNKGIHTNYTASNILVSNGGKQTLYLACQSLINPGDEVLILNPGWVSYVEQIQLAGGVAVPVECDERFHPDLAAIEEAITSKTVGIIINSPNNPTGAVYTRNELERIANIATTCNLWIISDEIYNELVYAGEHASVAEFAPNNTVVVNGLSKAGAITGWRIGYMAGPTNLIERCTALQSQLSGNVNNVAQHAAITALSLIDKSVATYMGELRARRDAVANWMSQQKMAGGAMEGAFYAWIDIRSLQIDSITFCTRLLEEYHIALVPGVYFGAEGFVRMSYARPLEEIETALEKLVSFCYNTNQ